MYSFRANAFHPDTDDIIRRRNRFYAECVQKAIITKTGSWLAFIRAESGVVKVCGMTADLIHAGTIKNYVQYRR